MRKWVWKNNWNIHVLITLDLEICKSWVAYGLSRRIKTAKSNSDYDQLVTSTPARAGTLDGWVDSPLFIWKPITKPKENPHPNVPICHSPMLLFQHIQYPTSFQLYCCLMKILEFPLFLFFSFFVLL